MPERTVIQQSVDICRVYVRDKGKTRPCRKLGIEGTAIAVYTHQSLTSFSKSYVVTCLNYIIVTYENYNKKYAPQWQPGSQKLVSDAITALPSGRFDP
jgi:hypothetical protein